MLKLTDRYKIQPPHEVRWLFVNSLWRKKQSQPTIYLTFDDGPVPEQTPWLLDKLDQLGVRATFFCVGQNVDRHREIYCDILRRGHSVGNHTYHHMPLFANTTAQYIDDVERCSQVMGDRVQLFRPPHGHMSPRCAWRLRKQFRHMVFWDVMPFDFDQSLTPDAVLQNLKRFARNGSIIVLHDSIKAGERMRVAVEQGIPYLIQKGYRFDVL